MRLQQNSDFAMFMRKAWSVKNAFRKKWEKLQVIITNVKSTTLEIFYVGHVTLNVGDNWHVFVILGPLFHVDMFILCLVDTDYSLLTVIKLSYLTETFNALTLGQFYFEYKITVHSEPSDRVYICFKDQDNNLSRIC